MKNAWFSVLGLLTALALSGCSAPLEDAHETALKKSEEPLINGADNRLEGGETADWSLFHRSGLSIAAVMPADRVNVPLPYPPDPLAQPGPVTFNAPTLKQVHNLCDGQRFENELTPATCTATLIDDDLVITDGHCVSAATCADTRFVFDYWRWHDSGPETTPHVFQCQSVVVSQTSPSDYAIVRLDRSTTKGQAVAPIRRNRAPLAQGLPLVAVGYADGTAVKLAPGGVVLSQDSAPATTFQLSNDGSAVGSLGGAIFYQETGELAGIWTDPSHGEADYVPGPAGSTPAGCMVAKACPEMGCGTSPSTATYVSVALDAYCASNNNPRLCQPRNAFSFSAAGPKYYLADSVYLEPGATLDYGTCGVPGSSAVGDTTIGLYGPDYTDYAVNDDGDGNCGLASHATYTTPPLVGGRYFIRPSCYLDDTCSGTIAYTVSGPTGGSFSYTAANTNSGQVNTQDFTISLRQGETLIAGTCGVENANFSGDSFLYLSSGSSALAFNDDACNSLGSQLTYTSPVAQTLTLKAGCYSSTGCSGTVAFSKGLSNIPYSATNTNGGTQNTTDQLVHLVAGDKVTVGTCGLPGASYTGDTVVSLYLGSTLVAKNDDAWGLGSQALYRVATSGDYTVRLGCAVNSSCGGNAVVRVTPPDPATGSLFYGFDGTDSARSIYSSIWLSLRAGDILSAGTCPSLVPGASGTDDTFLRLYGPDGLQTWASDDNCPNSPNTLLSAHTDLLITADKAGPYMLRSGCFGNSLCSGTTVYTTP